MYKITGEVAITKGLDKKFLDKIIEIGKEEGFELKEGKLISKEGFENISPEVWIFLGQAAAAWLIGKFLNEGWENLKRLIKKTYDITNSRLIINIKGNRNLIINFNLNDSSNLDEAFDKLMTYLKESKASGWQWYNEDEKEWGDINKVMKWKQRKIVVKRD